MATNIGPDTLLKWKHNGTSYCLHTQADDYPFESPLTDDPLVSFLSTCEHVGSNIEPENKDDYWQKTLLEELPIRDIIYMLKSRHCKNIKLYKTAENAYHCSGTDRYNHEFLGKELREDEIEELIPDILYTDDAIEMLKDIYYVCPVWAYIHSGISLKAGDRTYPYNDQFDSGLAGWAFIKKENLLQNMPGLTDDNWKDKSQEIIESTVEALNQWLDGDIWWFELLKWDDDSKQWIELESCGGFYGYDIETNGMLDRIDYGLKKAIEDDTITKEEARCVLLTDYGNPI